MNDRNFGAMNRSTNTFDPSSVLSGGLLDHDQNIVGEPLSSAPQAMPIFEDQFKTFIKEQNQGVGESEIGNVPNADGHSATGFLTPTDFSIDQVVAQFPGLDTALDTGARIFDTGSTLVEQSVESGSLLAKDAIQDLSDSARALLQDAVESWNDPDNSVHNALNHKLDETVDEVSELADSMGRSHWWAKVKQRIDTAVDATSSLTEKLSKSLGYGVSNSDISKEEAALESAMARLADNLMELTSDPDLEAKLERAFGDDVNSKKAEELIHGLANGESGPEIVVIDDGSLQGEGAFGDDKIFVSDELVSKSVDNSKLLDRVLLEETGHYLDQELNDLDSPGDEGEIFARLTVGEILSAEKLQHLQGENDHSTLVFENTLINIENAELSAEERSQEIERLEAQAQQLSTASPYASQAMYQEANDLREIARLEEDSQQLATASPYASQVMNEEAKQLREETYFYTNSDQSDTLLSYRSSGSMLSGQRVVQWQQNLKDLGYKVDVDGYFGPQTNSITRQFQKDNGLTVDGIVGPNTLAAIEAASSNVEPTPSEVIPGIEAPLGPVSDAINGVGPSGYEVEPTPSEVIPGIEAPLGPVSDAINASQTIDSKQVDDALAEISELLHTDSQSRWTPWTDGDREVTGEEVSKVFKILEELDERETAIVFANLSKGQIEKIDVVLENGEYVDGEYVFGEYVESTGLGHAVAAPFRVVGRAANDTGDGILDIGRSGAGLFHSKNIHQNF